MSDEHKKVDDFLYAFGARVILFHQKQAYRGHVTRRWVGRHGDGYEVQTTYPARMRVERLSAELVADTQIFDKGLATDSFIVDGVTYTGDFCEYMEHELNGTHPVPSPAPAPVPKKARKNARKS